MSNLYVATFRYAKGRYLVRRAPGGGYEGRRIHDRRQLKYGNRPDPATGLWLNEAVGWYLDADVLTLNPFVRKEPDR